MCIFKLCPLENALAHSSHAEGLSPVCSDHVDLQTLRTWENFCTTSAFVSTFSRNNQNFSTTYSSTTLNTSSSTSWLTSTSASMSSTTSSLWPLSTLWSPLRPSPHLPEQNLHWPPWPTPCWPTPPPWSPPCQLPHPPPHPWPPPS